MSRTSDRAGYLHDVADHECDAVWSIDTLQHREAATYPLPRGSRATSVNEEHLKNSTVPISPILQ